MDEVKLESLSGRAGIIKAGQDSDALDRIVSVHLAACNRSGSAAPAPPPPNAVLALGTSSCLALD